MKFALGLLLASLFTTTAWYRTDYSIEVTVEDHVLTSVNDKESKHVRIYEN